MQPPRAPGINMNAVRRVVNDQEAARRPRRARVREIVCFANAVEDNPFMAELFTASASRRR
ncbi:MAG: hypothetical protein WKF30_08175 [Pyrinomonadaceae bacterium]